jgi:hypothetical protein
MSASSVKFENWSKFPAIPFRVQETSKTQWICDKIIRKSKRYSQIPLQISESSETGRVSDEIIRKPKRFSRIPPRIPKELLGKNRFSKIVIRFPTMVKKYSKYSTIQFWPSSTCFYQYYWWYFDASNALLIYTIGFQWRKTFD